LAYLGIGFAYGFNLIIGGLSNKHDKMRILVYARRAYKKIKPGSYKPGWNTWIAIYITSAMIVLTFVWPSDLKEFVSSKLA